MARCFFASRIQISLAAVVGVLLLVTLVFCIGAIFFAASSAHPGSPEKGALHSLGLTASYAALSAFGQVLVGLCLAASLRGLPTREWRRISARRICISLLVFVYCLQPIAVEQIFAKILHLPTSQFSTLVAASIWQYAPFATLFFLGFFRQLPQQEAQLVAIETPSAVQRWVQIHLPRLLELAIELLGIRFLWMYTKFDLPFLFFHGDSRDNLLSVKVVVQSTGFESACYLAAWLCLPVLVLVGGALAWQRYFHGQGLSEWLASRVTRVVDRAAFRRGSWLGTGAALRVSGFLFLTIYLFPLLLAITRFGRHLDPQAFTRLITPLIGTTVLCGIAAAASALLGALLAYLAERGERKLGTVVDLTPALAYAVPLAVLSIFVERIEEPIWRGLEVIGSHLWASTYLEISGASLSDLAHLHIRLACSLTVLLAFIAFGTPFSFRLCRRFFSDPRRVAEEELALLDGLRGGIAFHLRVVRPIYGPAVLYSAFLAFVISSQDLALATRLGRTDFALFSFQLKQLADQHDLQQTALVGVALAFSAVLGLLFFLIEPQIAGEGLDDGRQR